MALLIGGFAFTANAQDRKNKPVRKAKAKTEKQIQRKNKKTDWKFNVNEGSKGQQDAERKSLDVEKDVNKDVEPKTLELKIDSDVKAKSEAEKIAIKENSDLFDEFVEAVDNCEKERNRKDKDKNQLSQFLEKALRLSTKINTKMLNDTQKTTFDAYKAKLNSFLKG